MFGSSLGHYFAYGYTSGKNISREYQAANRQNANMGLIYTGWRLPMSKGQALTITAAASLLLAMPLRAQGAKLRQWHGVALGSAATIALDHPQADRLIALALAEIDRLEGIFSLYRPDSALARLNRTGVLDAPPFELLDCLSLCGRVNAASGGRCH